MTYSVKKRLIRLKESNDIYRQGTLFKTENTTYYYDTGTGKVVMLDDQGAQLFEALFDKMIGTEKFSRIIDAQNMDDVFNIIDAENLLANPEVTHFVDIRDSLSEENLKCEQLIIELTGKCNLRCKYCIYGDHYADNRSFNSSDINFETAVKAIDYVYAHRSPDLFAVTFYGGEPLINFKTMRACIDYSLKKCIDCSLSFSFTTNLTLMTKEIAEYVAQIPNMSIVVSLDGPENVQNSNRTYANNKETFADAYQGLVYLADAIKKYNSNTVVSINSVLMPPYTQERFDDINTFFESLDFLPDGTVVSATYPSVGTVPDNYIADLLENGYDPANDTNYLEWAINRLDKNDLVNSPNLFTRILVQVLTGIHNRVLLDRPIGKYSYNACCIPSYRRLYVCTDGSYKVCEKMGDSPLIGAVDSGLDIDAIREYYFNQYEDASIKDCSKCWAINLCDICYAECYNDKGINIEKKRILCNSTRQAVLRRLSAYHSVLERRPEIIEYISTIELH